MLVYIFTFCHSWMFWSHNHENSGLWRPLQYRTLLRIGRTRVMEWLTWIYVLWNICRWGLRDIEVHSLYLCENKCQTTSWAHFYSCQQLMFIATFQESLSHFTFLACDVRSSTLCWKDCFLHWTVFAPLYLGGSFYGLSILFHTFIYSFGVTAVYFKNRFSWQKFCIYDVHDILVSVSIENG